MIMMIMMVAIVLMRVMNCDGIKYGDHDGYGGILMVMSYDGSDDVDYDDLDFCDCAYDDYE